VVRRQERTIGEKLSESGIPAAREFRRVKFGNVDAGLSGR
jgi:hypothetical protein